MKISAHALARHFLSLILLVPLAVQAETFTVNATDDTDDGACDGTHCSLREAIAAVNGNANAPTVDMIKFAIGIGDGTVQTIVVNNADPLPRLFEPVMIDGYSEPGAKEWTIDNGVEVPPTLLVYVNRVSGSTSPGFKFEAGSGGSTVRGLAIGGFSSHGVRIADTALEVVVEGNYIGIDPSGVHANPNGSYSASGVGVINAASVRIGGDNLASRNVIAGNGSGSIPGYAQSWSVYGSNIQVKSDSSVTSNVSIKNNYIGTDPTGAAVPAGIRANAVGVLLNGSTNIVEVAENVMSGTKYGILISDAVNATIQGNLIGTQANGVDPLPNDTYGIYMPGGKALIGGDMPGDGNTIAFNSSDGVRVTEAGGSVAIHRNSIHSNGGLGINTSAFLDPDPGMEILGVGSRSGGMPIVYGTAPHFNTTSYDYVLDFYVNDSCDSSGAGEGQAYLGSMNFTPSYKGEKFRFAVGQDIAANKFVTFTATRTDSVTTRFSNCESPTVVSSAEGVALVNSADDTDDGFCNDEHCSLREALNLANEAVTPFGDDIVSIEFEIPGDGPHVISPTERLPSITAMVTVNGYSQPLAQPFRLAGDASTVLPPDIRIVLDGANNVDYGLVVDSTAEDTQLIGLAVGGFTKQGLYVDASRTLVKGNYVGVAADGVSAAANADGGIYVDHGPNEVVIGGSELANRNVIAANGSYGIRFGGSGLGLNHLVQNNYVGVAADGATAAGNQGDGVRVLRNIDDIQILNNNIVNNSANGVQLARYNDGGGPARPIIKGNRIGVLADGTPAGNALRGILVSGTADGNKQIGGTMPGEGNVIAYNGLDGIYLSAGDANLFYIRGNSIFSNGQAAGGGDSGLGIRLSGSTNNAYYDPFFIDKAAYNPSVGLVVTGTNDSPTNYEFDFFVNANCDPSGYGEGERYLGSSPIVAGGESFEFRSDQPVQLGEFITATGTKSDGDRYDGTVGGVTGSIGDFNNASGHPTTTYTGFSACIVIDRLLERGHIRFSSENFWVDESAGMATIAVQRTGGSEGEVSVSYATGNGTAFDAEDYTASAGSLTWADGEEGTKTFDIDITDDVTEEGEETITLTLSSPTGGADLVAPLTATLTIEANDTALDTTPDDFNFSVLTDPVVAGEEALSSEVTITGIETTAETEVSLVTVAGAEAGDVRLLVDGVAQSFPFKIKDQQTIQLGVPASAESSSRSVTVTIRVGTRQKEFVVATPAGDFSPAAFSFADVTDADPNEPHTAAIQLQGLADKAQVPFAFSNASAGRTAEYCLGDGCSVEGATFTAVSAQGSGTLTGNETITVRLQAPAAFSADTQTQTSQLTLTVGSDTGDLVAQSDTYEVSTRVSDLTLQFERANSGAVVPGNREASQPVVLKDIPDDTPLSFAVSEGNASAVTVKVNGAPIQSGALVKADDSVVVEILPSSDGDAPTTRVTLTVAEASDSFSISVPDAAFEPSEISELSVEPGDGTTDPDGFVIYQIQVPGLSGTAQVPLAITEVSGGGTAGFRIKDSGADFVSMGLRVASDQLIELRVQAPSQFSSGTSKALRQTSATLTAGYSDRQQLSRAFTARSREADTEPTTLAFEPPGNVVAGLEASSNVLILEGIEAQPVTPASFSVTPAGAQVSVLKNGSTALARTAPTQAGDDNWLSNGDTLQIKLDASADPEAREIHVDLTVGGKQMRWTVTTPASDFVPEAFEPASQRFEDQEPNAEQTVNLVIAGLKGEATVPVSFAGSGGFRLAEEAAYGTAQRMLGNGAQLVLQGQADANLSTPGNPRQTSATLTVGSATTGQTSFTLTLVTRQQEVAGFAFQPQGDIVPGGEVASNVVTIEGLNPGAKLPISLSEDSSGTARLLTSAADNAVGNGDTVQVFLTASDDPQTLIRSVRISLGDQESALYTVAVNQSDFEATLGAGFGASPRILDTVNETVELPVTIGGLRGTATVPVSVNDGQILRDGAVVPNGSRVGAGPLMVRATGPDQLSTPQAQQKKTVTLTVGPAADGFATAVTAIDLITRQQKTTVQGFELGGPVSREPGGEADSQIADVTGPDAGVAVPAGVSYTGGDGTETVQLLRRPAGAATFEVVASGSAVMSGDALMLRVKAPSSVGAPAVVVTLDVGGTNDSFELSVTAADTDGELSRLGAARLNGVSELAESALQSLEPSAGNDFVEFTLQVSGINAAAPLSVSGSPGVSFDTGVVTTKAFQPEGTTGVQVNNGDLVIVRVPVAESFDRSMSASVQVGDGVALPLVIRTREGRAVELSIPANLPARVAPEVEVVFKGVMLNVLDGDAQVGASYKAGPNDVPLDISIDGGASWMAGELDLAPGQTELWIRDTASAKRDEFKLIRLQAKPEWAISSSQYTEDTFSYATTNDPLPVAVDLPPQTVAPGSGLVHSEPVLMQGIDGPVGVLLLREEPLAEGEAFYRTLNPAQRDAVLADPTAGPAFTDVDRAQLLSPERPYLQMAVLAGSGFNQLRTARYRIGAKDIDEAQGYEEGTQSYGQTGVVNNNTSNAFRYATGEFQVATVAIDTTPDPFTFGERSEVNPNTTVTSPDYITPSGFNTTITASLATGAPAGAEIGLVRAGESIRTLTWATSHQVDPGDRLRVRVPVGTAQDTNTPLVVNVNLGGGSPATSTTGSFTISSIEFVVDDQPEAAFISFRPLTNVAPRALVRSNFVNVRGFNTPLEVTVTGGTIAQGFSSNYASSLTLQPSSALIRLRTTASIIPGRQKTITVVFQGAEHRLTRTWTVTTAEVEPLLVGETVFVENPAVSLQSGVSQLFKNTTNFVQTIQAKFNRSKAGDALAVLFEVNGSGEFVEGPVQVAPGETFRVKVENVPEVRSLVVPLLVDGEEVNLVFEVDSRDAQLVARTKSGSGLLDLWLVLMALSSLMRAVHARGGHR